MTDTKQTEREAYHAGYQAGYEVGKRDAVKHGEWKDQTEPMGWDEVEVAVCSECGESYLLEDWDIDTHREYWKYCPSCGARMDGKESGE